MHEVFWERIFMFACKNISQLLSFIIIDFICFLSRGLAELTKLFLIIIIIMIIIFL